MILPERVLGSSLTIMIERGLAIGPISLATWLRSSWTRSLPSPGSSASSTNSWRRMTNAHDGLTGRLVGGADDGGLGDLRVRHERRLDLGGREPVARDVHDVVDAAEQPDVAVGVVLRAVAGEVVLLAEPRPVGLLVALRVAPDAAQHRRPRLGEHEVADLLRRRERLALVVEDLGADAGDRPLRRAGLERR